MYGFAVPGGGAATQNMRNAYRAQRAIDGPMGPKGTCGTSNTLSYMTGSWPESPKQSAIIRFILNHLIWAGHGSHAPDPCG